MTVIELPDIYTDYDEVDAVAIGAVSPHLAGLLAELGGHLWKTSTSRVEVLSRLLPDSKGARMESAV